MRRGAWWLLVALLPAACAAPQGRIGPSNVDAPASAPGPAPAAGPRATVDALPKDAAVRAFEDLPATRGAARPLAAAARPAAAPALRLTEDVREGDGVVVATAPEEQHDPPETLPSPTLPPRRAAVEPAVSGATEADLLRGGATPPTPSAPTTPPPAPPAVSPPSTPAPPPLPPVSPAPPVPAVPPVSPPADAPPSVDGTAPDATGPSLHGAALARRVRGFADLDAIEPPVLHAGERVIVYFELAHWPAPAREDGRLVTEAAYAVQIVTAEGRPLWSDAPQRAKDVSAVARADLFVTRLVTLPAALRPGAYAVRIVADDIATGSQAVALVPFQIAADPGK